MSQKQLRKELDAEPPELIKKLRWLELNWRKHWKLLVLASVVVVAVPIYHLATSYYAAYQAERTKPKALGAFEIKIQNNTNKMLQVNNMAELYISAPKVPGKNQEVSSGLIQLNMEPWKQLEVGPNQTVSAWAMLANEIRLLPYLDAGEYFGIIIFSASPRPIKTEVIFSRKSLNNGVLFVING